MTNLLFPPRFFALFACFCLGLSTLSAQEPAKPKAPPDPLDGPPFVTCKAWVIGDGKTGELLWGFNEKEQRPIASTTKIMNAWLVLQLAKKDPKVLDEVITFSEKADKTEGSTADLRAGEKIRVKEAMYGFLLPSGNDVGVAFAEHFGSRFAKLEAKKPEIKPEQSVELFVAEMNRQAKELGMKETNYLEPYGLTSKSSTRDLLKLAHVVMQDATFRSYVQTRQYSTTVETPDGKKREVTWKNTNQLLESEGYDGIKTGTTTAAGACLVSSGRRGDKHLIVVVLGSTSSDARYVDSRNLYRWAWHKLGVK